LSNKFVIYSDGGAELGHSAAAACIILDEEQQLVFNCVAFLGAGTNNEAEIAASLLGFSYIRSIAKDNKKVHVRWVSDSEYALKSATAYIHTWQKNGWKTANKKPVKNQGLWQSYLILSEGLSITPEHVRGHTGHPENEACDEACNWARVEGKDLINEGREGSHFKLSGESWMLLDGEDFLNKMRSEIFNPADSQYFVKKFSSLLSKSGQVGKAKKNIKKESPADNEEVLAQLNEVLLTVEQKLKRNKSPELTNLGTDLRALIKTHSK
jgi:ribonuclease HI